MICNIGNRLFQCGISLLAGQFVGFRQQYMHWFARRGESIEQIMIQRRDSMTGVSNNNQ